METKTLPSGAELAMTMAEFENGHALLKAVTRELEGVKISLSMDNVELIKNILMRAIYSEEINRTLKPCLARCTYNKRPITNELFEDEKIRSDYLLVVKEVLMFNLTPFFSTLVSLFKDINSQLPTGQSLKS